MLKIISSIIVISFHSFWFSEPETATVKRKLSNEITTHKNYQSFSKVLVYPMHINKDFTIINSCDKTFNVEIMDKQHKLIMSLNSSADTKTILGLSSFENDIYLVKMTSEDEVHQFEIVKSGKSSN